MHPLPLHYFFWGGCTCNQILKKVGLTGPQFLEKGCWELFPGVEIALSHWTWPIVFATWLVINVPNFKLCLSFCEKKWRLFSCFLGFKGIYQQSEIKNRKDLFIKRSVYLLHNIFNMCDENQAIHNRIILP